MREVKFRAWNKLENRWATHNELLSDVSVGATVREPSVLIVNDDEWELLSCTFCNDKNGKEIYEGDIVRVKIQTRVDDFETYVAPVIWSEKYCAWSFNKHDDLLSIIQDEWCTGEIIGNIYENAELLEEEKK